MSSTSLRTKDGSFSVAGAVLASEKAARNHAPIDMEGALAWGRENKVNLARAKRPLDRINAERARSGLPRFKIVRFRADEGKGRLATRAIAAAPPRPVISSQEELIDLITGHSGTVHGLITPEIAEWLLELNTGNRPLNDRAVERFRKILSSGGWINTGEPVIVSREGILNDGQHRLAAIRGGSTAAELDIRFGVARDAFHATGTGRRRTAGHVLSIEGYSNVSCQAAIARLVHHYDRSHMAQYRAQVENAQILEIIEADERIGQVAAKIQRSKFKPTRTGPFGFVLVVAGRTAPIERVFEFADLVSSGLVQDESDPARRLHLRLRDAAMDKQVIGQLDTAILTVKAWNAWAEGLSLPPMRVTQGDRTSEGFPKVTAWPEGIRPS